MLDDGAGKTGAGTGAGAGKPGRGSAGGGAYICGAPKAKAHCGQEIALPASVSGTVTACWQLGQISRIKQISRLKVIQLLIWEHGKQ